ncbi:hypothetical protein HF086_004373 [Spodoptera exigua]|uniref:Uncharacterized protein n=1 Tax=Spodoptera exigua TaxID=7107 RepID=A0A922MEJ3_SPOEX|nr:hypothetical protein HF086_004373 [Spodoptera exigua]
MPCSTDRKMLEIWTLVNVLHLAAASMFFHEPSSVPIKPEINTTNTDFGFSLAYSSTFGGLLVGAPTEDDVGKLYSCNLEAAFSQKQVDCKDLFIEVDEPEYENTLITGGTGWTTLADTTNGLLLTVKTSLQGDFLYTPLLDPLGETKSFAATQRNRVFLSSRWNIGYAVTAGKFFSDVTEYAFSMESKNMEGEIAFLKYNSKRKVLSLKIKDRKEVTLVNKAIGAMFGSALSAKDLNMDGLDELLVGAPALSEDECYECGALHIYLGGDQATVSDRKRQRTILGISNFGRFGSAIVANDVDGDNKPEIVVSAPYENEGKGAIYILAGHEVYDVLMKVQDHKTILLSDLKLTQKIQKKEHTNLGFSLQFVDDIDSNGCKELVAGSPSTGTAVFFKCVQKITVTLSSSLIGEQIVKEQDEQFVVNVCARVQLPEYPLEITAYIEVSNTIVGQAATIPDPTFIKSITCTGCSRDMPICKNVTVLLEDKEPGDYKFVSQAEIKNDYLMRPNNSEFNSSWVLGGPNSKLVTSIDVPRHCKGDDCIPNLSMELLCYAHKMNITDKQIRDSNIVYDDHEYVIQNSGFMTWKKVEMEIKMNKLEYLKSFTVKKYLVNQKLLTNSTSTLYLDNRLPPLNMLVNNEIPIVKEITLGSNKLLISLIALLVALILLAIITFILYKYGFFKRKQKKNLLIAKESVRRQSILQMEVDDDSPFDDPRPVTTNDNVGLVEDKPT